jgi:hypothetical protein
LGKCKFTEGLINTLKKQCEFSCKEYHNVQAYESEEKEKKGGEILLTEFNADEYIKLLVQPLHTCKVG